MKKKITYADWTKIGKLNYAAKWLRPLCTYVIIKKDDNTFKREQFLNVFLYALLFIPVHLLQALMLVWEGGLKEFTIAKRFLGYDILYRGSEAFSRAEQIWESK